MIRNARIREGLYLSLLLCATAALLLFPKIVSGAIADGLSLCGTVILPSLFPFFVCAELMNALSLSSIPAKLLEKVMMPIFHIRGAGSAALLLGLFGGYPSGTQVTVRLYASGALSRSEAEHLLLFCNNAGPAFVLGVVGCGIFGDLRIGFFLWGIHLFCALLVGFLLRPKKRPEDLVSELSAKGSSSSFAAAFTASVRLAGTSALYVCMFILFFSVLSAFLQTILPDSIPSSVRTLLVGMLELSNGISLMRVGVRSLPLAAFLLGFSGLGVCAQAQALLFGTDLSFCRYLPAKLLHGILSVLLCQLLLLFPGIRLLSISASTAAPKLLSYRIYIPLWFLAFLICLCFHKFMGRNSLRKRV